MILLTSVGAYVPDGILSEVVRESQLHGASKSQIVRFSLLRLIMSARDARVTVFGEADDVRETKGRVDAKIPDYELALIRERFPDTPISELTRYGLNVAAAAIPAGMTDHEALESMKIKRGPKPRSEAA